MALDTNRGSILWEFHRFRTLILAEFATDIHDHVDSGFEKLICDEVKDALARVRTAMMSSADGAFLQRTVTDWKRIEEAYEEWNSHEEPNAAAKRRRSHAKLARRREAFGRNNRARQLQLGDELSDQLISQIHAEMAKLALAFPNRFLNLSYAVKRFAHVQSKARARRSDVTHRGSTDRGSAAGRI